MAYLASQGGSKAGIELDWDNAVQITFNYSQYTIPSDGVVYIDSYINNTYGFVGFYLARTYNNRTFYFGHAISVPVKKGELWSNGVFIPYKR